MKIEHIRHATVKVQVGDQVFLVDPMLAEPGAYAPVALSRPRLRNPLTPLGMDLSVLFEDVTAVVVTHVHFDHFDESAGSLIPKRTPIICRAQDLDKLNSWSFANVTGLEDDGRMQLGDVSIQFRNGPHGWGLTHTLMGTSASVLFTCGDSRILFSGDRRNDPAFRAYLDASKPDTVIVNGGAARLRVGRPISWEARDVRQLAERYARTEFHVVHMDALNHCSETSQVTEAELAGLSNVTVHRGMPIS